MIICSYSRWRALSRGRVARFGATDGSENRGTGERGGATATTREPGRPRDEAARGMSTEGRRRRPSSLRAAHAPLADTAVERVKRAERGAQSVGEGCGRLRCGAVRFASGSCELALHQFRTLRLDSPSNHRAVAVRVARGSGEQDTPVADDQTPNHPHCSPRGRAGATCPTRRTERPATPTPGEPPRNRTTHGRMA
jgi:hypothetical protein